MSELAFLTLAEAAKLIPGADENTLKRMHRAGKLVCYRPGKSYLTTAEHVLEAVTAKCRVVPKVRDSGYVRPAETVQESSRTNPLGLSSTALANTALDLALEQATPKRKRR